MSGFVGRLLVASTLLEDPSFRRAVVLVLDHNDLGATGIVVNRPLDVDVASVLPGWQPYLTAPGRLFRGGPVQLDSALGVAAVPGDGEPVGVHRILGALGLVDLDGEPAAVARGVTGLRVFAGYAGWSPGQLEDEVAQAAWYVVDAEPADAFSAHPERLWRDVLRRQRGDLALVSTFPDEPSRN